MRAPLAMLALAGLTACASGTFDNAPVSAFAGPWTERDGNVLVVAYSSGGGVFATARDLGERLIAGETLRIDGECKSACTLALMDIVAPVVCWTDDTRFLFHAAHVNGRQDDAQTAINLSALPAPIRARLPHPAEWRVDRWHEISGSDAHRALGRGYCKEIG